MNEWRPLRTGALVPGADADIVVWDPKGTRVISAETHHQNIDFNVYEGMEVTGIPVYTLSRGAVVYEQGELKTVRGKGRYVDRPCYPSYWKNQALRRAARPFARSFVRSFAALELRRVKAAA